MDNLDILAAIEEWIDEYELDLDEPYLEGTPDVVSYVEVLSLTRFIRGLLT